MPRALTGLLAMVAVAAVAGVAHVQVAQTAQESTSRVELKIALAEKGRCTRFVDAAAGIVAVANANPGQSSTVTRLCLRASGRAHVQLGIRDLTDVERACTGQEASVDATCRVGGPGELAGSLLQQLSVEQKCFTDAQPTRHAFLPLAQSPLDLGALDEQRVVCVVLSVRYEPASSQAAHAAQTDRAQWRYVFGVVGD